MRLVPLAAALVAFALPAGRHSHPALAGTWVLDASKSTTDGPIPLPGAETDVVTEHGDTIDVDIRSTTDVGELAIKRHFVVDGKAWPNLMSYQGTDMQLSSILTWKGSVLGIETTTDYQGTPVEQSETWTASPDGKVMTMVVTTNLNGAYFATLTKVFNKQ